MGGGGGNVGYGKGGPDAMRRAMQETLVAEQQRRLDADVNRLLQGVLMEFNAIDRELIRARLLEIDTALGEDIEFDQFLYAGSLAKHTAIEGLSDVDALLVFDRDVAANASPEDIRQECRRVLAEQLDAAAIESITTGRMAVTVRYTDGLEIQLLPAIRSGDVVSVPNATGSGWVRTRPFDFQRQLTAANERLGGKLVPGVKLFKSLIAAMPSQQQLSGYHAEALAIEAAESFPADRPRTLVSVVSHLVSHASDRVLRPMPDVTGQSDAVDEHLGPSQSPARRLLADALGRLHRRMSTASSVAEWEHMIGIRPE